MLKGSIIENCYTSNITFTNAGTAGVLVGYNNSSLIKGCFYEYGKRAVGEGKMTSGNHAYYATATATAEVISSKDVAPSLNKWINTTGSTNYGEYKFSEWTQGEDIPAIFINERE